MKERRTLMLITFVALACLVCASYAADPPGRQGCCSGHKGVCPAVCPTGGVGYRCCDGTRLSATCEGYYECAADAAEEGEVTEKAQGRQGCCSFHGGVVAEECRGQKKTIGYKCKDGTAISATCSAYYKTCWMDDPIKELAKGAAKATAQYFIVAIPIRMFFQYGMMYPWMVEYGESFINNYQEAILGNPSLLDSSAKGYNPGIANAVSYSISIMLPFYVMAIVLTGAYIMFISGSIEARVKAKSLLKRLIVSMIFFAMSPLIIETMLVTSQNISSAIIGQADPGSVRMVLEGGIWGSYVIFCKLGITDLEVAIAYWTSLYVMAWLPYMVIGMRHIMMTLFIMIFPIGIALYSFVFFRGIGRKILEQTIVWIYLQAFLSVAILVISLGASYYYILPPDQNPKMTNAINPLEDKAILPIMDALTGGNFGASMGTPELFGQLGFLPLGATSILSYAIGSMAYGLLVAVPFMMLRLLNNFLP
jgi:hypothetical protein